MTVRFKTAKIENGYICLKPLNLPEAAEFVDKMKPDVTYTATIRRQGRSLTANAYCWTLLGKLAEKLSMPVTKVYRRIIVDVGDNYETLAMPSEAVESFCKHWEGNGIGWIVKRLGAHVLSGYEEVIAFYGSSTYDTKQMSRLIDLIVQECRELNIETMRPDKLASLLGEWGEIRDKENQGVEHP
jgi:hypothetical protein